MSARNSSSAKNLLPHRWFEIVLLGLTLASCAPKQSGIPPFPTDAGVPKQPNDVVVVKPSPSPSATPSSHPSSSPSANPSPIPSSNPSPIPSPIPSPAPSPGPSPVVGLPVIPAEFPVHGVFAAGALADLCAKNLALADSQLAGILQIPAAQHSILNTLDAFETSLGNLSDAVLPLAFLSYVSTDDKTTAEAASCKIAYEKFVAKTLARRDLFQVLSPLTSPDPTELRLLGLTLARFRKFGVERSASALTEIASLRDQLVDQQNQFQANLRADSSSIDFSAFDLGGMPKPFINALPKTPDGQKYRVDMDASHVEVILKYATRINTRKLSLSALWNRAATANLNLLNTALQARGRIATLSGFANWTGLQVSDATAGNQKGVEAFLDTLSPAIIAQGQSDLDRILQYKKQAVAFSSQLDPWDIDYFATQLKTDKTQLEDEGLRPYFPIDTVLNGFLDLSGKLLGLRFTAMTDAPVWNPDVKLFRVTNSQSEQPIAYLYTDLTPRPGKWKGLHAFSLGSSRSASSTSQAPPISALVGSFQSGGLAPPELKALFQEFGHVLRQILTRAPYASLAGTRIARDSSEVTSRLFGNWAEDKASLIQVASKIPAALATDLASASGFYRGYDLLRELLPLKLDLTLHTQIGTLDPLDAFNTLYQSLIGIAAPSGNHFAATLSSLMNEWGTEVGEEGTGYARLWSEVRAVDALGQFSNGGLGDPFVGASFRRTILEPGNLQDADVLLKSFLGRDTTSAAFLKRLGP